MSSPGLPHPLLTTGLRRLLCLIVVAAPLSSGVAQTYRWTTFAGSNGGPGLNDGTLAETRLAAPQAAAVDSQGNIYTADANNHSIRRTTPAGVTTTFAGKSGAAGHADGAAAAARLLNPRGIALDPLGFLVVADSGNHTVRRISAAGIVTTLAGAPGLTGSTDGPAMMARFNGPRGITAGADGVVYLTDGFNQTIRRIAPDGTVSTLAGTAGAAGSADGNGPAARFLSPRGIATLPDGAMAVADSGNHTIRRLTAAGEVTTIAGRAGAYGATDSKGADARFHLPSAVAADAAGSIYVADVSSRLIRRISPGGTVTTMAGAAYVSGFQDGENAAALFMNPAGLAVAPDGRIIIADTGNHALRAMTPAGGVSTLAGVPRMSGRVDAPGEQARFNLPAAIAMAPDGSFAVADEGNHLVRKLTAQAAVSTLAGVNGTPGMGNGPALTAQFQSPAGVCYGPDGTLYVGDTGNRLIRRLSPAGEVNTLAGTFDPLPGEAGVPAYEERMMNAAGIALDADSNIYAADGNMLRRISAPETFVYLAGQKRHAEYMGRGSSYFVVMNDTLRGDNGDGPAEQALIRNAQSPVCDATGNIYFADSGLHTIRRCTPEGTVTTLAGIATLSGHADGSGEHVRFNNPTGLTRAADGSLYVADTGNQVIRRISPGGLVTTIGGLPGYAGTGEGAGGLAQFAGPAGITLDAGGALLVADRENHRIARGVPDAAPQLVAEYQTRLLDPVPAAESIGASPPGVRSSPQTIRLHNTGSLPLEITGISLESVQATAFSITPPPDGTRLAPNASATLTFDYLPTTVGTVGATLVIRSNDPARPEFRVRLTGFGNTPPVFSGYTLAVEAGQYVRIPLADILAQVKDAENHAVTITVPVVRTQLGVVVQVIGADLAYSAQAGAGQTVAFTLTDELGAQTAGVIQVRIRPSGESLSFDGTRPPLLERLPDGQVALTFEGIPGLYHQIQRSTDLSAWTILTSRPAADNGLLQWTDPAPPAGSVFYRLAIP